MTRPSISVAPDADAFYESLVFLSTYGYPLSVTEVGFSDPLEVQSRHMQDYLARVCFTDAECAGTDKIRIRALYLHGLIPTAEFSEGAWRYHNNDSQQGNWGNVDWGEEVRRVAEEHPSPR